MRKTLAMLLLLFTSLMYLSAQGNIENTSAASERQVVSFTDDLGRVVDVPADISSVTPSGSMAQVILLTFDQSKISGLTTAMSDEERAYYPDLSEDIPVLGTFYGKKANLNKEALIVVNPDVVIDIGEIKGSDALEHAADSSGGIAFSMYPTSMEELLRIADSSRLMPPKSTWFEPKLRSGLFIHRF